MTEVRITIAGHTNHGKTSIVRTLTDDVTFGQVANRPITVDVSAQNITGAALPGALRIFDTPGLERATDALASLSGNPTFDGVVKYFKTGDSDAGDLATLEQIQNHTDVVLYVVRLNQPITQDYKDEFHILRISGVPLIPIFNFVRGKNSHKDAWIAYLKTEGCHEYTEYDAHAWEPGNERNLWNRVNAKLHDTGQQALVEAWRDTRLKKAESKDNEAAKIIAELLRTVAAFRIEKRVEATADKDAKQSITNQANKDFTDGVRDLERQKLISILNAYQLNIGSVSRAIVDSATSSHDTAAQKTIPDLFGPTVQRDFRIGLFSGMAKGAVTGGVIDAFVGGASFMTGMVIGTVVGGVLGAGRKLTKSHYDPKQSTLTISSSPEALEVILGRALTLTRDLHRRGFANQSAPDLASANKHVPPDAKTFLAKQFNSPRFRFTTADPRQATMQLEAEILRWIEQPPNQTQSEKTEVISVDAASTIASGDSNKVR